MNREPVSKKFIGVDPNELRHLRNQVTDLKAENGRLLAEITRLNEVAKVFRDATTTPTGPVVEKVVNLVKTPKPEKNSKPIPFAHPAVVISTPTESK